VGGAAGPGVIGHCSAPSSRPEGRHAPDGLVGRDQRGDPRSAVGPAVEAFELRIADDRPALLHVGTVLLPGDKWPTDVAALPDAEDGFTVSSLFDPRQHDPNDHLRAGELIGQLLEWP
jgi:hypothetical protein